jgi:hypothetical protein
MKEQYRRLMQGFVASTANYPATIDLLEAVRGLPEVGQLPPPWVTWTLVQLVGRLCGSPMEDSFYRECAAFFGAGSREQETDCPRPDPEYPHFEIDRDHEWEHYIDYGYFFYENARTPKYPRSLDPIDDSMTDRSPFVFVPEFLGELSYYYNFDWPIGRIGRESGYIEPSTATAELGVAELEAAGLVERVLIREGSFGHSLTPAALEHAASIAAYSSRWRHDWYHANEWRVWLAAAIGDWPAAHAAALDVDRDHHCFGRYPELVAFTRERASRCRALRDADPRAQGQVCDVATAVLRGGYPYHSRQYSEEFSQAIRRASPPPDRNTRTDDRGDDVPWPPGVQRLLDHSLPLGRLPRRSIERKCYGATPQQRREIIQVFARDETMLAEAAHRAFTHAPEQALTLVRRGLLSPSVRSSIYTAALLGAIDEKWSRQELWQALHAAADPNETVKLRAALRYSQDKDTVRAVAKWERAHGLPIPGFPELSREEWTVRHRVERYRTRIGDLTYPTPPLPPYQEPRITRTTLHVL